MNRKTQRCLRGYSLLETVMAASVCAVTLVPALQLMRDQASVFDQIETRNYMVSLCVSKMEEHIALTAGTWANGTFTGDFSTDGFSSIRYSAVRSDATVDGGSPNALMAISATVFYDANANGTLDSGEMKVVFATKLAKMALY